MAKAPVLKTGGRKPLQVRILCPPPLSRNDLRPKRRSPGRLATPLLVLGGFVGCADAFSSGTPEPLLVTPSSATVLLGHSEQFQAVRVRTLRPEAAVRWDLLGVAAGDTTCGTISAQGLYVAPRRLPPGCAAGPPADVLIRAVATSDSATRGTARVQLTSGIRAVTLAAFGTDVAAGDTVRLVATVDAVPGANMALEWGSTRGRVDSLGVYIAPLLAGRDSVWVRSAVDSSQSAGARVLVVSTLVTFNELTEGFYDPDAIASQGVLITETNSTGTFGFVVDNVSGVPGFPASWKPNMLSGQGFVPGPSGGLTCNYSLRFDFVHPVTGAPSTVTSVTVETSGFAGTRLQAFDAGGVPLDAVVYPSGLASRTVAVPGIAYAVIDSPQDGCHVHDNVRFSPETIDWAGAVTGPPVPPPRYRPAPHEIERPARAPAAPRVLWRDRGAPPAGN